MLHVKHGASFCIAERIVVIEWNIVNLTKLRQAFSIHSVGTNLVIIRRKHIIISEGMFQNGKIEIQTIVRNNRLSTYKWLYYWPNLIKCWGVSSSLRIDSMYLCKTPPIKIIWRLHQKVNLIDYDTIFDPYKPNLTDAPALPMCRFEINCCKTAHYIFVMKRQR